MCLHLRATTSANDSYCAAMRSSLILYPALAIIFIIGSILIAFSQKGTLSPLVGRIGIAFSATTGSMGLGLLFISLFCRDESPPINNLDYEHAQRVIDSFKRIGTPPTQEEWQKTIFESLTSHREIHGDKDLGFLAPYELIRLMNYFENPELVSDFVTLLREHPLFLRHCLCCEVFSSLAQKALWNKVNQDPLLLPAIIALDFQGFGPNSLLHMLLYENRSKTEIVRLYIDQSLDHEKGLYHLLCQLSHWKRSEEPSLNHTHHMMVTIYRQLADAQRLDRLTEVMATYNSEEAQEARRFLSWRAEHKGQVSSLYGEFLERDIYLIAFHEAWNEITRDFRFSLPDPIQEITRSYI